MPGITTYLKQAQANKALRNTNWTHPTTPYVALHTGTTGDDGTGAEVANANGYTRMAVTFGAPDVNGVCTNSAQVTFPTPSGSWGTVVDAAIWDSGTYGAGNMLVHGVLPGSLVVTGATTIVKFPIGTISVEVGG